MLESWNGGKSKWREPFLLVFISLFHSPSRGLDLRSRSGYFGGAGCPAARRRHSGFGASATWRGEFHPVKDEFTYQSAIPVLQHSNGGEATGFF